MNWTPEQILSILDRCNFTMLDNGYIYLAATRLSLYRSDNDCALVIEVFGFSPRYGMPSTYIDTFASSLHNRPKTRIISRSQSRRTTSRKFSLQ